MSRLNNLSQGNLGDILRRIARLEMGTPLASSSMGRGRLRLYDGSVLLIENGALQVTGTATVSGSLKVTGTADVSGTLNVSGTMKVTGPSTLNGKVTIGGDTTISGKIDVTGPMATKGTLSVEGVTTLRNDLNIVSGGKITAGSVTIDPAHLSGSVRFANGSSLSATPNGAQVAVSGGGAIGAAPTQAFMAYGGYGFVVDGSGMGVQGNLPTTSQPANVYINPSTGRMYLKV